MLTFSPEQAIFEYQQKSHITTNLFITNESNVKLYYKFKVTRPKYYLVKNDKGFMEPGQKKEIIMTLHREGVLQAVNDKFKCFYNFSIDEKDDMNGFEERSNTQKRKLMVKIVNLPSGYSGIPEGKSSAVKSLMNTQSKFQNKAKNSTSLQATIEERENRLNTLKEDIKNIRTSIIHEGGKKINQQKEGGLFFLTIAAVILGILSSFWI